MLIRCDECRAKVSNRAATCPHCGNPLADDDDQPTVIEKTSKKWKAQIIGSAALMIFGILIILLGFNTVTDDGKTQVATVFGIIGTLVFLGGLGWYGVIRYFIWWHHE